MKPYRSRLPVAPVQGGFLLAEDAIEQAERLLPTYRGVDGDHEGIVFLCGRELPNATLFSTVIAPGCNHGRGHVMCSLEQIAAVTEHAHRLGLGVLGQVHSHPGGFTEHSPGDDDMVLMPFQGMLSIVVPHYARYGMRPLASMGVHQYTARGWVRCEPSSIETAITCVPSALDLR